MARLYTKLREQGDTIVEVMICMAVVSAMLGGAFVTARSSQLDVRNSQEHAEALALIENQIEQLRTSAANANSPVFTTNPFCMSGGTLYATPAPPYSTSNLPNSECVLKSDGTTAPAGYQPAYTLVIEGGTGTSCDPSYSDPQCYQYDIQAIWDEVVSNGQGTETVDYRLYQLPSL